MADFPHSNASLWPPAVIAPTSMCSLGGFFAAWSKSGASSIWASGTWPTANTAVYIPFVIDRRITIRQLATYTGGTVSASNNLDIGIYDVFGNRIVSSGSTAQSTTASAVQTISITATDLARGAYFMAMNCDNTAATFQVLTPSNVHLQAHAVQQQAVGAVTLPATATFANPASTIKIPLIMLCQNSVM